MQGVGNQTEILQQNISIYATCKVPAKDEVKMPNNSRVFRGFSLLSAAQLGKQGPCFLEQGHASKRKVLQCLVSAKINMHTKTEKKMLTKT